MQLIGRVIARAGAAGGCCFRRERINQAPLGCDMPSFSVMVARGKAGFCRPFASTATRTRTGDLLGAITAETLAMLFGDEQTVEGWRPGVLTRLRAAAMTS
jgi:hypothetical protein